MDRTGTVSTVFCLEVGISENQNGIQISQLHNFLFSGEADLTNFQTLVIAYMNIACFIVIL